MNEYVYLSLKQNFYNEIQLDSTQSCIIVKNICPCGFSKYYHYIPDIVFLTNAQDILLSCKEFVRCGTEDLFQ